MLASQARQTLSEDKQKAYKEALKKAEAKKSPEELLWQDVISEVKHG